VLATIIARKQDALTRRSNTRNFSVELLKVHRWSRNLRVFPERKSSICEPHEKCEKAEADSGLLGGGRYWLLCRHSGACPWFVHMLGRAPVLERWRAKKGL
jgi:hypothetical protein